jgi:hypothetical protein
MFLGPNSSITGGRAGRSYGFAAGTTMLFIQAAAPVGWSRVTANDDALLRINGSTTPGAGGSNGFTATFNTQTAVGSTTLTSAQIPAHSHPVTLATNCTGGALFQTAGGTGSASSTGNNTGGGGSHNHTITTSIKYVDALVAKKN